MKDVNPIYFTFSDAMRRNHTYFPMSAAFAGWKPIGIYLLQGAYTTFLSPTVNPIIDPIVGQYSGGQGLVINWDPLKYKAMFFFEGVVTYEGPVSQSAMYLPEKGISNFTTLAYTNITYGYLELNSTLQLANLKNVVANWTTVLVFIKE